MKKTNWTNFYNSEQELINDMLAAKSDVNSVPYYQLVKGYEYIDSFKKYYGKNHKLTEKQMVQLKRLAGEIFKNVHGESEYYKKSGKRY